jgi:hypothetical protein
MLARATVLAALAGSAAAFSPMMSMETGRRQVVQAGAAAAVAAPLLRSAEANAVMNDGVGARNKRAFAPIITIMDHRGCQAHANKEYFGAKSYDINDEMCVKVQSKTIPMNQAFAEKFLQEVITFKSKGIDGPYTSNA